MLVSVDCGSAPEEARPGMAELACALKFGGNSEGGNGKGKLKPGGTGIFAKSGIYVFPPPTRGNGGGGGGTGKFLNIPGNDLKSPNPGTESMERLGKLALLGWLVA